ncbi:unnamed protein product [Caenorhabditis angaria]|uniref:Uncharacterized protein n=1 Tax=Caenorhabditis angaria TaxID=860376 RepID=A0A9P1IWM6_9PELO|nr:unnamed protein product [Caenorhabditis angaria]
MGFLFENDMCNQSVWNTVFRYLHRYGEFGVVFSIFTLSLDRLISVVYINLHSSKLYKLIFTLFLIVKCPLFMIYVYGLNTKNNGDIVILFMLVFTLFLSITLVLVIMLKCLSKHIYYKTQGTLPLNQRFQLSQNYELSKNLIRPIFISLIIKITLLLSFWLLYFRIIPLDLQYHFFSIWNLIFNFDTMLFPILFLCSDRIFGKMVRKFVWRKNKVMGIQTLSGLNIQKTDNQCSHFGSLNNEWNA